MKSDAIGLKAAGYFPCRDEAFRTDTFPSAAPRTLRFPTTDHGG